MRRFHASSAALVLTLAFGALAQDAMVEVKLVSGAQYRGELVERVPDDHLTIKLATGEVKTFKWVDIDDTAPPAPPPHKVTPPERKGTYVHIDTSDEHVILQKYAGMIDVENATTGREDTADAYTGASCEAPCDVEVSPGSYRLKAPGKSGTDVVSIAGEKMTLQANMHDSWHRWARWTFLGFAGITALMGGSLVALAANPPKVTPPEDYSGLGIAGAVLLGTTAAFLGLSIYCFATTTSSVTAVDANGHEVSRRGSSFVGGVTYRF